MATDAGSREATNREEDRAASGGHRDIGSTAVPGLAGKPIIDITAGLRRLSDARLCIDPLASLGYVYVPEYEVDLPERRYFRKGPPDRRTHHLHKVEEASESWERYLLFRDHLRTHRATAQEYEALRRRLAREHGTNREPIQIRRRRSFKG